MRGVWAASILVLMMSAAGPAANAAQSKSAAKAPKNPVPATAASIKAGQQVYNKQCRHCHGLRGQGDGPLAPTNPRPSNLTDAKWDWGSTDGEIFNIIWNGVPKPKTEMKGMKGTLQERDVWNVVNYIRSIGPKNAPR